MKKLLVFLILNFIKILKYCFYKITNKNILFYFNTINEDTYEKAYIKKSLIKFFTPNEDIYWRVKTLLTKEPETIDFINRFNNNKKIIFWDIGSNIGLYSIYAAATHKNIEIISFEPSFNNLRVLARNISVNGFSNKIKIISSPLLDKANFFSKMRESTMLEGSAINSFHSNLDFAGKVLKSQMDYNILGTSIDDLIKNKILEIPHYIKIDVDGLEHLILKSASLILKSNKIKKISVELNENYKSQYDGVLKIMKKHNFELTATGKTNSIIFFDEKNFVKKSNRFSKTFNFHFNKINK